MEESFWKRLWSCRLTDYWWWWWWWGHGYPKHVENRNKHTRKSCASSWLFTRILYNLFFPVQMHSTVSLCSLLCCNESSFRSWCNLLVMFQTLNCLMFCWPCIVIYPHNENQQVTLFTSNLFQWLTSTCFEQAYCSSSGVLHCIYSNWYMSCQQPVNIKAWHMPIVVHTD